MASRRMITSDIWEDEWFGELGFFEQALWIGLFSKCADDQGRLKDNPILIRASVFPYKDIDIADMDNALEKFVQANRIIRYEIDGKKYVQLKKWWCHQKPQWAARSHYPPPTDWIDRIRTRENGVYVAENWDDEEYQKAQDNVDSSGEDTTYTLQVDRQYPVPVPVPISSSEDGAKAPEPPPEPKPPENTVEFDTPGSEMLLGKLRENAQAQGRRGPKRFRSLQQKNLFLEHEHRLGSSELSKAIDTGLARGVTSIDRLVSWTAKWNTNGKNGSPPREDTTKYQPVPIPEEGSIFGNGEG